MTPITWANCQVTLGELQPWADNPRLSTKAQARRLLESWQRFGQVQTIAIGPAGQVYDGHQRLSALLTLHGKSYQVDARRSDRELTDEERRVLVVTLHAGAVGAWDWDSLSGWEAGLLQEWGFDSETLTNWQRDVTALGNLLASEEADSADAEPQIDRAAALQEKWQVKPGDLWRIGEHKLACGDCTDKAVVERLGKVDALFTDPPYGINYDPSWLDGVGTHRQALSSRNILQGDDGSLDLTFLWAYDRRMVWGFPYIFDPQATGWIVWDKQPGVEDRGIVTPIEMASTTMRKGFDMVRVMWGGYYRAAGETRQPHPTQKPVGVIAPFIEAWTKKDEFVFDPFLGSGTTMISCQNLGRRGRGIEISPEYCAVVLQRMSDAFPGIEIERIADDGRQ